MDFPVWQLFRGGESGISAGLVIALIAVIHVFVAQFAVGGGFFLVAAEWKGHREGSAHILKWVHRHTKFFLLLTMVFGSMTGVGIWLVISLLSPAGIALLVREFLYAWAAEWVFFLGEIVALLLYAASFSRCRQGRMDPKAHMALGAGYCLFAFLSLFIINGVISFMLTPGKWLVDGSFWSALFNPGFWPALTFRFGLCLTISGLFGLITATSVSHEPTRTDMVRFCAKWICLPFVLMIAGAFWYKMSLSPEAQAAVARRTSDIRPFVRSFIDAAPLLFLAGMLFFIRMPRRAYRPLVIFSLLLGLIVAGAFEWVRETARRPWLVHGYLYSNGITPAEGKLLNEQGMLARSGWAKLHVLGPEADGQNIDHAKAFAAAAAHDPADSSLSAAALTPAQRANFGRFLFTRQCSSCHGVNGPMLDIVPRVAARGRAGVHALLAGQGQISPYMPPFFGTPDERRILAEWLAVLAPQK